MKSTNYLKTCQKLNREYHFTKPAQRAIKKQLGLSKKSALTFFDNFFVAAVYNKKEKKEFIEYFENNMTKPNAWKSIKCEDNKILLFGF